MEADSTPATSEEESEEEYVVAGHILATTECAEVRLEAANPAVGLGVGLQGDQQFLDRGGCLVPHAVLLLSPKMQIGATIFALKSEQNRCKMVIKYEQQICVMQNPENVCKLYISLFKNMKFYTIQFRK